jgi:NAD(P)H dehydrogenase (quinone)
MGKMAVCACLLASVFLTLPTFLLAGEPPGTIRVLVAYHSVTGNTEKMAQGVAEGVKSVPGDVAVLRRVQEVTAEDLF